MMPIIYFYNTKKIFLLTLCWAMVRVLCTAQVTATLQAATDSLLIGDPVSLTLRVKGVAAQQIRLDTAAWRNTPSLEWTQIGAPTAAADGTEQSLQLTLFEANLYQLPPLPVVYEANGSLDTAYTQSLRLTVLAPPLDSLPQLAPIKDIVEEPLHWTDFLKPILAAVALIALLGLAFWWWKRPKKASATLRDVPVAQPHPYTEANERLAILRKQIPLQTPAAVKTYYTELTDIVRTYLERQWQLPAREATTDDIVAYAARHEALATQLPQLTSLLRTADLIKFAKASIPDEQHETWLLQAMMWLKATHERTPVAPAPAPSVPPT